MTDPIRPQDISSAKAKQIPDFVIEAVNNLLVKKISGNVVKLYQNDVLNAIISHSPEEINNSIILDNDWLDFEIAYMGAGWHVEYNDQAYEPYFIFRAKTYYGL